jgi:general stress protein 26
METAENPNNEGVKKLNELIKSIETAMLVTADTDGTLRSRPMGTQQIESDGDLWFFTGRNTGKTQAIEHDQHVNISYSSPKDNRFVSVSGRAELIEDKKKVEELWNPLLKAWFPEGIEDPNLTLIRVHVESAEYWDFHSSTMVQLMGFAKSIFTGKQIQPDKSQHDKISLKH